MPIMKKKLRPQRGFVAAPRSRFHVSGLLIFGVAFSIRLLHVWHLQASPFYSTLMGDSRSYDEWARRLAAGDWIGSEVFYQAPLYPYFLGALYRVFGHDLLAVRIVQALIGSGGCVLLGLATARLFSARAGLIAGLMLAGYAPAIFFDALIQKSVLDLSLICLILFMVSQLLCEPRRSGLWLGLGTALGALSLTRENALIVIAAVVGWALITELRATPSDRRPWPRVVGTLALLLGLAVVLLPVAARNTMVGGGWYLTTSQFGPNLYIGNNPRADGTYVSLREGRADPAYERNDAIELAEQALGRPLSPADVSSFWRARAWAYIRAEPVDWLKLTLVKLRLLVSATEMVDTEAQESHMEWSVPLRMAATVGNFGVLLPLAFLGAVIRWDDRRRLLIVYIMAVVYAVSVVAFYVVARYRLPLVPFAVALAAAGVSGLPAFVRGAARRHQVIAAAGVVGCASVAQLPALSSDLMRAITETNLGVAIQQQARFAEATTHYRRAIQIRPDYVPAYNNLGVALRAQGKLADAQLAYRQAIERRPNYLEAHHNLATALIEDRKANEALVHFEIARPSMPPTPGAHNNYGVALAAAGRRQEAIAEFRVALALEPDSPITLRNLGDALASEQQYPEAIEHLRRLTELDAANPGGHYARGSVLMQSGQVSAAAAAFRAVVELAPDSAPAHNSLGVALAAQGAMDEAIVEFREALRLQPDYPAAARFLAQAQRARKEARTKN
jgi:tetratricopeptide (TPR) repeat protein